MEICNSNCNVRAIRALSPSLSFCCTEWELGFMICGAWLASLVSSQLKSTIAHVAFIPHRPCYWNLTCLRKPYTSTWLQHLRLPPVPTKGASARLTTRATHCFLKAAVNCSRLLLPLWVGRPQRRSVGQIESQNIPKCGMWICESNIIRETIPALIHKSTYLLH